MDFFSIVAAAKAVKGAAGAVKGLANSRRAKNEVDLMLKQQIAAGGPEKVREAAEGACRARAIRASKRFLRLHDVDGNGHLSVQESGLHKDVFAGVDANQDGRLSLAEVRKGLVDGTIAAPPQ